MAKDTALTIEIRAVDRATAVIRAVNAKIAAIAKPTMGAFKDIGTAIGSVLSRIGSVIGGVLDKIPLIGAVTAGLIGGAVGGLTHLINQFDDLGDKAERFGVSVDFLASIRFAAEKAGAPVEALDAGLQAFSVNMGKLSANTGRFKKFLDLVSPALEQQLKKAKSNEEAFYLLAAAMDKLKDPAKRAALAAAAGLGPELAPLLAQGEHGVKKLAARYTELAGSQEDAAKKAGDVDDSMHELHAAVQGAEAAIVSGLAPAMKIIVEQLRDWFVAHRADIAEWAKTLGEKIPGAFKAVVDWVGVAIEKLGKFFGILEDIYDKVKDLTHANDAQFQAQKVATTVPAEKRVEVAKAAQAQGEAIAATHDSILSQFGGIFGPALGGLANTDIGIRATENFVGESGALVGVNKGFTTDNIRGNGSLQFAIADELRRQAAAAVQSRPTSPTVNNAAAGALAGVATANITVKFENAPRGTRVNTDPKNTADVDLNVGYQGAQ